MSPSCDDIEMNMTSKNRTVKELEKTCFYYIICLKEVITDWSIYV